MRFVSANSFLRFFGSLLGCAFLLSCQETNQLKYDAAPQPLQVASSEVCAKKLCIELGKKDFDRIFLLTPSSIVVESEPQWQLYKPQLVTFRRYGDQVGLYRINHLARYDQIQADALMASMEILQESDTSVAFQWSLQSGIFKREEPIDMPLSGMVPERDDLELKTGIVEKITQSEDEIHVVQSSSAVTSFLVQEKKDTFDFKNREHVSVLQSKELNLKIHFLLEPYFANHGFEPIGVVWDRDLGFFSQNGLSPEGEIRPFINRWDLNKEISVVVPSDAPESHSQAIKEAVGYWNRLIGQDVLVVKTGKTGVLRSRTIAIRLVHMPHAHFAYAGFQADPVSGEIQRGHVYLPVDLNSSKKAEREDELEGRSARPSRKGRSHFGRHSRKQCRDHFAGSGQNTQVMLIAHELGHVLGLRHNFAATFGTVESVVEMARAREDYLLGKNPSGAPLATSVMDYPDAKDDEIIGAFLRSGGELPYDKIAAEFMMGDLSARERVRDLNYCSDGDLMIASSNKIKIYGCDAFDRSPRPLVSSVIDRQFATQNAAELWFRDFVNEAFLSVSELSDEDFSAILENQFPSLPTLMIADYYLQAPDKRGARVFSINSWKDAINTDWPSNLEQSFGNLMSSQLTPDELAMDFQGIGGLKGIVEAAFPQFDFDLAVEREAYFDSQIEELSDKVSSGTTAAGQEFVLSERQRREVLDWLRNYAQNSRFGLLPGILALFPSYDVCEGCNTYKVTVPGVFSEDDIKFAESFLLKLASGKVMKLADIGDKKVSYPVYNHGPQVRSMIIERYLDDRLYGVSSAEVNLKQKLASRLTDDIKAVLSQLDENFSFTELDEVRTFWGESGINSFELDAFVSQTLQALEEIKKGRPE